ncbi:hypothetical protein Taro_032572 [Colocasia esculenta]|uniref:Retrotransposon gag domain-containing protein n=1 Tax=Colocasia esculenta TaxID=4460 RepID=A0A843VXP4_COLES|nr:hypothetical protein [Colocasia esculenta]
MWMLRVAVAVGGIGVDANLRILQLAAPVSLKLLTGSEEWLDDRRTRGVAELREETPRRGAIPVGARGGLGVNREIAGEISEMADRRDWGGGGDDPEESTQRMIERIWESLTDIRARMDQQVPVPPVAVPSGDGEAVPVAPVPPRVEVPFVAPVPPPPPVQLAEEPVMQVERFLRLQPPTYSGGPNPDTAEHWVHEIERVFATMRCSTADKVVLAAYQLRGFALEWWRLKMQTTFAGRTEEAITWPEFLDIFNDTFFPIQVQQVKREQFRTLQQGNSSVLEYQMRFMALSHYAPYVVSDNNMMVEYFIRGLRVELQDAIVPLMCKIVEEAAQRAATLERSIRTRQAATILLEEVEILLGLKWMKQGEEDEMTLMPRCYTSRAVLKSFLDARAAQGLRTKKGINLQKMAAWTLKELPKAENDERLEQVMKGFAICVAGTLLFLSIDNTLEEDQLGAVCSIWEGERLGLAVLAFLYSGLTAESLDSWQFLVLEAFVLRWSRPARAGDVFVPFGARRRRPFLREGPNGFVLRVELCRWAAPGLVAFWSSHVVVGPTRVGSDWADSAC